jgi:hypothetical protein
MPTVIFALIRVTASRSQFFYCWHRGAPVFTSLRSMAKTFRDKNIAEAWQHHLNDLGCSTTLFIHSLLEEDIRIVSEKGVAETNRRFWTI